MTTQISPKLLLANGVPVFQASHDPGTFIVTFPRCYHGGFSYGVFYFDKIFNLINFDYCSLIVVKLSILLLLIG